MVSVGHCVFPSGRSRCPGKRTHTARELSVEMKRVPILFTLLLVLPIIAVAQTQTRERRSADREGSPSSESTAVRTRVVGPTRAANHADKQRIIDSSAQEVAKEEPRLPNAPYQKVAEPGWGNTSVIIRPTANERSQPPSSVFKSGTGAARTSTTKLVQPTLIVAEVKPAPISALNNPSNRRPASLRAPVTALYHVGVGDVLDIRLSNMPTRESTLYTVLKNGILEYPLLNGPISVAGLSTEEIAKLLSSEIRVIQAARVSVSVRDYASHAVIITGLVDSPGRKVLRREAMPLYAVLAEALPRPEATVATVVRGGKTETVPLRNEPAMLTLVLPGDVIKVSGDDASAKAFVYIGGEVTSPGEKEFRDGMTLTQALISAGGVARTGKTTVKVARRNANGFLRTNEFNLRSIEEGKLEDPLLQAGDRIEVTRGL